MGQFLHPGCWIITIVSLNCCKNEGEVQSSFDGDTMHRRGYGNGVGTCSAWGCAKRNRLAWFLDNMSAELLVVPAICVAVI